MIERCNHRAICPDCNDAAKELEAMVDDARKIVSEPIPLPRPDRFLCLYAYDPAGAEYLWQTGQVSDTEEEAIAYGLTVGNVHTIRIVRIEGLEKFVAPDTLKKLHRSGGEIIDYAEPDDEQDTEN